MKTTNWTQATQNPIEALTSLMTAIKMKPGIKVWLELQKNGDQAWPVMVPNSDLSKPENWTMSYGVPSKPSEEELQRMNEYERDMTLNYTACFGEPEAIEIYYREGRVTKGLMKGIGTCFAMKKTDVIKHRHDLQKMNWTADDLWTTYWKPKGIAYQVPADIDKVYVICINDELPMDEQTGIQTAIDFLESLKSIK